MQKRTNTEGETPRSRLTCESTQGSVLRNAMNEYGGYPQLEIITEVASRIVIELRGYSDLLDQRLRHLFLESTETFLLAFYLLCRHYRQDAVLKLP